jgi:hypothetical protein
MPPAIIEYIKSFNLIGIALYFLPKTGGQIQVTRFTGGRWLLAMLKSGAKVDSHERYLERNVILEA